MYLKKLLDDEIFWRYYGENIKLARLFPVDQDSYKAWIGDRVKFDEVSSGFKELLIVPWTCTSELTIDDLEDTWNILKDEKLVKYFLNNEKPPQYPDCVDVVYEGEKENWNNIPHDLNEAMIFFDNELNENEKNQIRNYKHKPCHVVDNNGEILLDNNHFCYYELGTMWMRNTWGLWQDSPLAHWFRKRGIWMADDISSVISTAYYHHLIKDKIIDDEWIENERKFYDNYWIKCGIKIPTYEEWLEEIKNG